MNVSADTRAMLTSQARRSTDRLCSLMIFMTSVERSHALCLISPRCLDHRRKLPSSTKLWANGGSLSVEWQQSTDRSDSIAKRTKTNRSQNLDIVQRLDTLRRRVRHTFRPSSSIHADCLLRARRLSTGQHSAASGDLSAHD